MDMYERALAGIEHSLASGRFGHAYIIQADPAAGGSRFARAMLSSVFAHDEAPAAGRSVAERIEAKSHPDVVWIEPESKSRKISVDQIRLLNQKTAQTSYEGGWKAGVIAYADRLGTEAANAFLKTLEEPPPRSVFLLLTDQPDGLLSTVVSRCHLILLSAEPVGTLVFEPVLLEQLAEGLPADPLQVFEKADAVEKMLKIEKERIEKETGQGAAADDDGSRKLAAARIQARLLQVRDALIQVMERWFRDMLLCSLGQTDELFFPAYRSALEIQAGRLSYGRISGCLRMVETLKRQLDRNIRSQVAMEYFFMSLYDAGLQKASMGPGAA